MSLSPERLQDIANMANGEWCHLVPEHIQEDDDAMDALEKEWEAKASDFCQKNTDPEELHAFADLCNWDFGTDCLIDIVRNSHCDLGTAQLIFWRAQPDYYQPFASRTDVPEVNQSGWSFITKVMEVCKNRNFNTAGIKYDPASDYAKSLNDGTEKWLIPEIFKVK